MATNSAITPSPASSSTPVCQEPSARSTCNGIQGEGSKADICCAEGCTCTCDEVSSEDQCNVTKIRASPPDICTGEELTDEPCSLAPPEPVEETCGVEGVLGIADSSGEICCPIGCGQCGGSGCGEIPMSWVKPGSTPLSVEDGFAGSASGEFCCTDNVVTAVCGEDTVEPPCLIPQEPETAAPAQTLAPQELQEDSCGVEGVSGIADSTVTHCCPLGCGRCGGVGCGTVPLPYIAATVEGDLPADATASDYCCTTVFDTLTTTCGVDGGTPPCHIEQVLPTPAPTVPLAPLEPTEDTCGVEGVTGLADSTGLRCCPTGCGECGFEGCGTVPLPYIAATVEGDLPADATASDYCCTTAFNTLTTTCGVDGGTPPCHIEQVLPTPAPTVPLAPLEPTEDTCGVEGVTGLADSTGLRCCPTGCGGCGFEGCSSVPLAYVAATVEGDLPEDAKSADYCCTTAFDNVTSTCGVDGAGPPCVIPSAAVEDSCHVEGVSGVSDTSRSYCCPIGCGQCGGSGCGSIAMEYVFPGEEPGTVADSVPVNATSGDYCCTSAFANITTDCSAQFEPPCLIPEGTIFPTPGPSAVTSAPSTAASEICETITVEVEKAETFDGTYVMDDMDSSTFIRTDSMTVMTYVPFESSTSGLDSRMTDSAANTDEGSPRRSLQDDITCGRWVLSNVEGTTYPQVSLQDCALHPEDVDAGGLWVIQDTADMVDAIGSTTAVIECVPVNSTAPTMPPTPVAITRFPIGMAMPTVFPTMANVNRGAPSTVADAGDSSDGGIGGLSKSETIGVGVAIGAAVLISAVVVGRWVKSRRA